VKWLALVSIVAATAAACGSKTTGPSSILGPSQEFLRPAIFSLSGTVLTAGEEGSVPVEGARVEISGDDVFETYTDAEGRYRFAQLERATWRILVQKEGYADSITEIELSGATTVDIMLEHMEQ
jgi:hypothetical protein